MLSKRLSKIAPLFAGAVVAGLSAQSALATLTIDLRVTSSTGGVVSADSKTVTNAPAGSTVTMAVWAQVTGSNPAKNQTIQSMSGSFLSDQGGLLGNLVADHIALIFTELSSSFGVVQDLDTDTDSDIGGNGNEANDFFRGRAAKFIGPRTRDFGDLDVDTFGDRFTPHAIASGTEYRMAIIEFAVGSNGGQTHISFRPWNVAEGAVWYENSDEAGASPNFTYGTNGQTKNPANGLFQSLPVNQVLITQAGGGVVPEPMSLGLIGLAGLGLVSRRRKA